MPALGLGEGQPARESGEFTVHLKAHDEVEMVGHKAIVEELDGMAMDTLAEDADESGIIFGIIEDCATRVSPIDGMIDQAAFGCSRWSSHASQFSEKEGVIVKNGS